MSNIPVDSLSNYLNTSFQSVAITASKIPGSAIVIRYVKSSYQNDPFRTLLELGLIIFAVRLLLARRYDKDLRRKNDLTEREIDELVNEWQPEPLVKPLPKSQQIEIKNTPIISGGTGIIAKLTNGKQVTNFGLFNFHGFVENPIMKKISIDTLRIYGVGACGPSGFYGTLDVHMQLEKDISEFLGMESTIIYAQGFSTISSVIPAFAKRGDLIVADKGSNFSIQKGIQISRSNVIWYEHNNLDDLERILKTIQIEDIRRKGSLTRRFIITEGIFENYGDMVNLPRIIELKKKYKLRLILDESLSFGQIGKHGRGLSEYFDINVRDIDMLVGSLANSFCASGGFCCGSQEVISHQVINGPAYVFSAALPAVFATTSIKCIEILSSIEGINSIRKLNENISFIRSILETNDKIKISSSMNSPIIHIHIKEKLIDSILNNFTSMNSIKFSPLLGVGVGVSIETFIQEQILQLIVDDALLNGILISRQRHNWSQEMFEQIPAIRVMVSSIHTREQLEHAGNVIKQAIDKYAGNIKNIQTKEII